LETRGLPAAPASWSIFARGSVRVRFEACGAVNRVKFVTFTAPRLGAFAPSRVTIWPDLVRFSAENEQNVSRCSLVSRRFTQFGYARGMDQSGNMQNRNSRRAPVLLAASIDVRGAPAAVKLRNLSKQGALIEGDQ